MKNEYSKMNDGDMHKPYVESYQAPENQYAGMEGKPLNYIERRDKIQSKEASKVRSQEYHGRYE